MDDKKPDKPLGAAAESAAQPARAGLVLISLIAVSMVPKSIQDRDLHTHDREHDDAPLEEHAH